MIQAEELTGSIIKIYYRVYNALGHGFLESIYHNAMLLELLEAELTVETQKSISVYYNAKIVGSFFADLVVDDRVIIELKAKESLHSADEAQLINYLRATDCEIGLLFNFGKQPEFKRKFFSNDNKSNRRSSEPGVFQSLFISDPFESA